MTVEEDVVSGGEVESDGGGVLAAFDQGIWRGVGGRVEGDCEGELMGGRGER